MCTEKASELIEKHFLDLRNKLLNQENIRAFFFSKQEKKPTEKSFLSLLQEKLT